MLRERDKFCWRLPSETMTSIKSCVTDR